MNKKYVQEIKQTNFIDFLMKKKKQKLAIYEKMVLKICTLFNLICI